MTIGDTNITALIRKYSGIGFILISIGFGYGQLRMTTDAVAAIAQRMNDIDQRGTTGSRLAITSESDRIADDTRRIEELEKSQKDLIEKYSNILSKLDTLAALLENRKQK